MITLLSEETSIIDEEGRSFLELTWRLDTRFGAASIEVYLDASMYAVPSNYKDGVSVEVTYGPPSISLEQAGPIVSADRKVVTFKIHNVPLHLNTKGSVQRVRIGFQWRNPNNIPERVEINVGVKSFFFSSYKEKLVGFNTTSGIIKFLTQRSDSSFHFPKQSPIYRIPYWEFSKDAALYQSGSNTTIKSITWPTELAYWHSSKGEEYLISQIRKLDPQKHSTIPTRIAICPFEAGMSWDVSRLFLQEMEVHARLGVRVRVISPKALFKVINDNNSIALYGSGLGLDFQGTDAELSAGSLALMLDSYRIRDLDQMYNEVFKLSSSWIEYKNKRSISFSDEESGIWIFNRVRQLKVRVKSGRITLLHQSS